MQRFRKILFTPIIQNKSKEKNILDEKIHPPDSKNQGKNNRLIKEERTILIKKRIIQILFLIYIAIALVPAIAITGILGPLAQCRLMNVPVMTFVSFASILIITSIWLGYLYIRIMDRCKRIKTSIHKFGKEV